MCYLWDFATADFFNLAFVLQDFNKRVHIVMTLRLNKTQTKFVCLFAWGLTALSAQIGYIAP